MPNRIFRDTTNSDKIDKISFQAEVFFYRLMMKADDYGCYWADEKRLKGNLFILKLDKIREADISRWLAECHEAGLIVLYEVSGKRYLQIIDFGQRKRRMNRQFPPPTDDSQVTVKRPPEDEDELEEEVEDEGAALREIEDEKFTNNRFFEKFRRVAASHLTDKELRQEVGRFRNKYPNVHINQSGGLINAWVANIGKQEKQVNERAKNLRAAKAAIERHK